MDVGLARWDKAVRDLRQEAAEAWENPLDEEIIELAVALRLLGFPTIGSCAGHPVVEGKELCAPFVGMRWRMASRFERDDDEVNKRWYEPDTRSKRERHYLALLAWRRYRPLAWRLRELLALAAPLDGRPCSLHVYAGWWGITLGPKESEPLETLPAEEATLRIAVYRKEMLAFGRFLHHRVLSELESRSAD